MYKHLGQNAQRVKVVYERVRKSEDKSGDWVWYYYPRKFTSKSPKWQRNYIDPYRMVRVIPPVNFVLQKSQCSRPFVVHAGKLKKCHSPPVIDWTLLDEGDKVEIEPTASSSPVQSPVVHPVSRMRRPSPEVSSSDQMRNEVEEAQHI